MRAYFCFAGLKTHYLLRGIRGAGLEIGRIILLRGLDD